MQLKTAALAGLLGISPRRLNQLVEEGIAVRTSAGMFDAAKTVQAYVAHASGKAAGAAAMLDVNQETARLRKVQADGQELKNAITRGEFVASADVTREWADIVRTMRSAMLAVPARCRRKAGSSFGPTEIAIIDREVRDALEALSNDQRDAPEGAGSGEAAAEDDAFEVD